MCATDSLARHSVLILATICAAGAYRDGRAIGATFNADFPPYQSSRQHPPYHEAPQPFREPASRTPSYRSLQRARDATPYKDQPTRLFRERSPFAEQSYYRDQSAFSDDAFLKEGRPAFKEEARFIEQSYRNKPAFGGELQRFKSPFGETLGDHQAFASQASALGGQRHAFRDETAYRASGQDYREEPYAESGRPYREETYDKPIDSYREADVEQRQPLSFGGHSSYLKYGNHGLGFASVPAASAYESALPLSEDESASSLPTSPAATREPMLRVATSTTASTVVSDGEAHSPTAADAKIAASTAPSVEANTLANSSPTGTTPTTSPASTAPKQAQDSRHNSDTTTSVTESTVAAFDPSIFRTTKFSTGTTPSFYVHSAKSNLQDSTLNYLVPDEWKSPAKGDAQGAVLRYLLPEVAKGFKGDSQGAVLRYLLPEVAKGYKSDAQDAVVNYLLPDEQKRALGFQAVSRPETLDYASLALAGRAKLAVPGVSIASAIARPLHAMNYEPATLPRISFVTPEATTTTGLTLGQFSSSQDASTGVHNLSASIPMMAGAMPAGIPGGITGGITGSIPAGIPGLNFGQSFQHAGQLRQIDEPRGSPYATGLQLQLGGFGGLDYALHPANPALRPMELGIAKVGLSLPELPRTHVPAFAKIGFGQHLW